MQPFPDVSPSADRFFFRPGAEFTAKVYLDPRAAAESGKGLVDEVVGTGEVAATGRVVVRGDAEVSVDVEKINRDPWSEPEEDKISRWRDRFSKIGKEIQQSNRAIATD